MSKGIIELPDDFERTSPPPSRRRNDGLSIQKALGIVLGVITVGSLVFTVGYNWRSIAMIESTMDNFVRKDVQGQQLQNINDRLTEMSRQLEKMGAELERERRR